MLHVASRKQCIIHNIHLCNIVISRSTHFTIYSYLPTVYRASAVFLQVFVQIFQANGIIFRPFIQNIQSETKMSEVLSRMAGYSHSNKSRICKIQGF